MLRIYNSLTDRLEPFEPLVPGKVGMYVCGMTVYDYCHLGHARMLLVFDMVARYLRSSGYDLTYVRNITDIDDKIIARANENGETTTVLTQRFIDAMHEDCVALGIEPPDLEPRATQYVPGMVTLISSLIDKGVAYAADNGDVYFSVAKFPDYGKLSGNRVEDLRAGARVAVDEAKRAPEDFVLWKASKPGEPTWDSPWGPGRPGWHIECSVMSMQNLGEHFDLHGGGKDLIFPHHECELAQAQAATGKRFVNTWMHNGFVRIDDEKMSKSMDNFFTIRDILTNHLGEVVRYYLLLSHYRSALNYSSEGLSGAHGGLSRLYNALRDVEIGEPLVESEWERRFNEAMDDDFKTPEAIAVLFDLAREVNRATDAKDPGVSGLAGTLHKLAQTLGLLASDPLEFLQAWAGDALTADAVEALIAARKAARVAKSFAEADRIRDELQAGGISLEDHATGTTWRREVSFEG
ncbi:MAG: cysteinyl-tRNA synthetase [Gammaproteobacteria bacterium]|jgi:cysteinyl-tRNA synthetase